MATDDDDTSLDITTLTEHQQSALAQYTSVTAQAPKDAILLLRRCQWNVQNSIDRFFDGEPPGGDPTALDDNELPNGIGTGNGAHDAAPPPPRSIRQQETLMNSFITPTSISYGPSGSSANGLRQRHRNLDYDLSPAPRVVGVPENRRIMPPPTWLSLLLTPVNTALSLLTRLWGIVPFLPRLLSRLLARRNATPPLTTGMTQLDTLNYGHANAHFLETFNDTYGPHSLPLWRGTYASAYDAAKRDSAFLLAIPLCPTHPATPRFVRDVLLSVPVSAYLTDRSNNTLIWAGSTTSTEPYAVSTALEVTSFPFAAFIAPTPSISTSSVSVLARFEDNSTSTDAAAKAISSPEGFVRELRRCRDVYAPPLEKAKRDNDARRQSSQLRESQNSAYERSLAVDRERAQKKKEEEVKKRVVERQRREELERKERYARDVETWKRWRARRINPEPEPAPGADVSRLSIRLLDGERVVRRFAGDVDVEEIYAFVECFSEVKDIENGVADPSSEVHEPPKGLEYKYPFRLVSPMPREVYELDFSSNDARGGSVAKRIGRSGNVVAERIEDSEESSEGEV